MPQSGTPVYGNRAITREQIMNKPKHAADALCRLPAAFADVEPGIWAGSLLATRKVSRAHHRAEWPG
ncbi:hypothetical protein BN2475_240016 [Paraburkholderia ribeironis]|uniref:Uncharacterized protein n=1 Tax=Paraburkholderia ribeironis TaxID=1247936 RepID=A0A1N7RY07_9BURK|nr:hypothetical protein BN2475_240016 [Paraburkholderia ribeironis]